MRAAAALAQQDEHARRNRGAHGSITSPRGRRVQATSRTRGGSCGGGARHVRGGRCVQAFQENPPTAGASDPTVRSTARSSFFNAASAGSGGVAGLTGARLIFSRSPGASLPARRQATSAVSRCWCEKWRALASHVRAADVKTGGLLAQSQATSSSPNGQPAVGRFLHRDATPEKRGAATGGCKTFFSSRDASI